MVTSNAYKASDRLFMLLILGTTATATAFPETTRHHRQAAEERHDPPTTLHFLRLASWPVRDVFDTAEKGSLDGYLICVILAHADGVTKNWQQRSDSDAYGPRSCKINV